MILRNKIAVLVKIFVTVALMWLLFTSVSLDALVDRLTKIGPGYFLLALACLFISLALTGLRWHSVCELLGVSASRYQALKLMAVGHFFNQILPTSVGGDAVRGWLLSRGGCEIRAALFSVICDRATALIYLFMLASVTYPIVLMLGQASIPGGSTIALIIGGGTVTGILILHLFGPALASWLRSFRRIAPIGALIGSLHAIVLGTRKSIWIFTISVLVQFWMMASVFFFGLSLGIELGLTHLLLLPVIFIIAAIPISFAGWGLRESAMVGVLGFTGLASDSALALSVCYGLGSLLIGVPGILIFAFMPTTRVTTQSK